VGTFLPKDVEFVAYVYKGLVDDFARQSVKTMAIKVFKTGRKKFSRLTMHVGNKQVSAWDYYCYGLLKGNSAYSDKFIYDFLRLALLKRIEGLPLEHLRLVSLAQFGLDEIDSHSVLNQDMAISMIEAEIRILLLDHGQIVQHMLAAPVQADDAPALEQQDHAGRIEAPAS
jgi:hypothetical protein